MEHELRRLLCVAWDRRRAVRADQLRPDAMPVSRPKVPAPDRALSRRFDLDAQLGTWFARLAVAPGALPGGQLREIDGGDAEPACEGCHAPVRQLVGVGPEVHSVLQSAQLSPKHSAQLAVMQGAYASGVRIASQRHLNRRARLAELVAEVGGATALSIRVGTPKSHVSALLAGARGIGDQLAAKIEKKLGKPPGWMDRPAAEGGAPAQDEVEYRPSDWALLQDLKLLPEERLAEIRAEAAKWRRAIDDALAKLRAANGQPSPPAQATVIPLPEPTADRRPGLRKNAMQKRRQPAKSKPAKEK